MEVVELGVDGVVIAEDAFQRAGVGLADGFTVPACAF